MLHTPLRTTLDETKKNMPPQTFAPPAKERIPLSAGAAGTGRSLVPSGGMRFRTEEARRLLPKARMPLGNQATLRMLGRSASSAPVEQGKCGCGGGGSACSCKQKGQSALGRGAADRVEPGGVQSVAREELARAGAEPRGGVIHQQPEDEEGEKVEYNEEGARVVFQGSGTCVNGGAGSSCKFSTGVFSLDNNNNTCCTKGCTAEHEKVHKTDIDGWGCCKNVAAAWNAKGADQAAIAKKYNDWQGKVVAITECNAYSNDVVCADKLATAKDCAGAGKDTDCCKDIADYRARYGALAKTNCAAAPAKAEPCPTF